MYYHNKSIYHSRNFKWLEHFATTNNRHHRCLIRHIIHLNLISTYFSSILLDPFCIYIRVESYKLHLQDCVHHN